jgi:isoleucyl-tRNA synthetase
VRWYLYTVNAPWTPTRFYEEGVTEAMRRFMGTLWNVYAFYVLYANIDGFVPREHSVPPAQRAVIDRWLLSRLAGLVQEVTSLMDSFDITAAGRRIEQFVDDLSNWYVRRCRRRYWASEMTSDKEAAYLTLHEAIVTLAKLIAPFTPFLADEIYGNLEPGRGSVHLADYPVPDKEAIDPLLDSQMELARQVVYLGRAARNAVNIKNRQPLSKIVVQATPEEQDELMALSDLVEDELNVRGIEFARDFGEFVSHRIKPRYDLLGPKHGKLMRGVASALASADATRVARDVAAGRPVVLTLEGAGDVSILPEEMTVETVAREGFHVETDNGRSVALDTVVTDDLKMEGFARELVNKIQATRKEAGFEISDRIYTVCAGGPESMRALAEYGEYLMGETLSVSLVQGEPDGEYIKEWDVNGEKVTVGVRRVR